MSLAIPLLRTVSSFRCSTYKPIGSFLSLLFCVMIGTAGVQAEPDAAPAQKTVTISLQQREQDSAKQIVATVVDESGAPAVGAELKFYLKRHFGKLPFGPDVNPTDEHGQAVVDFPSDIPADTAGNCVVIASIEDSDAFEDCDASLSVHWGTPTHLSSQMNERALWAARANAPWLMVLLINAMIAGVWLTIVYVIVQIFKIKRIGKV